MSFINLYLEKFDRLKQFYEYNPSEFSSYLSRAEYLDSLNMNIRAELVDALLVYNRQIGCGSKTEENLAELQKQETLAVVTGQQAGLFTGPLYTIYKACTTVVLAMSMQEKLKRKVVPIFWVASEDHDFEEINHIYTLTEKGIAKKLGFSSRPFGKPSVGDISLPGNWEKLIDELGYYSPETQHKSAVLRMLRETGKSSSNLAQWFAKIMTVLFRNYGLIFIDPMLQEVRQLLVPGVQRALKVVERVNHAVSEKENCVNDLGFEPQIIREESNSNLFIYSDGQREALHKTKDKFYLTNSRHQKWSRQELEALCLQEPTSFSPNVVLRPIFQDLILPTLCYVAGPGEIAYYAQLKEVYPLFGLKMPIIYPRKRITLMEPQIRELLTSYNLSLRQVEKGLEAKLEEYLQSTLPADIDGEIDAFIDKLEDSYRELLTKLTEVHSDVQAIGAKNLTRLRFQVEYLRKKTWQKHRRNNKKLIRDFLRIKNYFSIHGKPQERVYNFMTFLIGQGPSLIEELIIEINYEDFNEQVLTLGE